MARKAAPKHVEPEEESQEMPEEEPEREEVDEDTDSTSSNGATISKAEAIRRALTAGHEGPQEGTAYIRREFGIELSPQHFSATKAQIKSRAAKKQGNGGGDAPKPKGRPGRKPREAAQPETAQREEPRQETPKPAAADMDMVGDLAAIKHLVQRLGVEQVKKIADLFE